MTSVVPYPAPRFSNKSGTITVQFGSYSTNFGLLGTSPGRYINRSFVNAFFNLPLGIYSFNLKEVALTLPPGYANQETIGGTVYNLPTPTFLLEGTLFNTPEQLYTTAAGTYNGGIIIPADKAGIYHHNSTGADTMVQLNTTVVQPNWKCQYFNLTSQFVPLNLRINNRSPTDIISIANVPNFWIDEPIPTISGNASWPWKGINNEGVVADYLANSDRNLINVILTIEYNRIDALPINGV
jgi:hypothetical protein